MRVAQYDQSLINGVEPTAKEVGKEREKVRYAARDGN